MTEFITIIWLIVAIGALAPIAAVVSGTPGTLSPPQLARRWGVSADSIRAMIRAGRLPPIHIGEGRQRPRVRIALSVIERIEAGELATTTRSKPTRRRRQQPQPEILDIIK